jgi:hypothetical protein
MASDDCVEPLIEATGGRLSRKDIIKLLSDLDDRAKNPGGNTSKNFASYGDRLLDAAGKLTEAVQEAAAIAKRNEALNETKRLKRREYYHNAYDKIKNVVLALEAKLVGVNTPFKDSHVSVDSIRRQLHKDYIVSLITVMRKDGVDKLFASRQIETEWTRELFEINKGERGSPGVSKNAEAKRIAEIIHQFQRTAIDGLNREGAWIKSYTGYITKTTHDPDRVRQAGREAWVDRTLQLIDVERTFGTPTQARKALNELWTEFKNGNHYKFDEGQLADLAFANGLDLAKQASVHRELHFKSAEDWLAYSKEFGSGSPTETVMRSLEQAARHTAMMREFGTNPRAAFDADIAYLKDKYKEGDQHLKIKAAERMLNNRFGLLDGTSYQVANRLYANLTANWMAWQRMSKLGLTPFSMLVDLATKSLELRYQGVSYIDQWSSALTGYFKGAKESEGREVADLLLAGKDSSISSIASHFDGFDTPVGVTARAEHAFFFATGISAMTDNQRGDLEVIMARHLGMQRGKAWNDMPVELQRLLPTYGIGEREWALFHKAEWLKHPESGRVYLTPQDVKQVPDDLIEGYLRETKALGQKASPEAIARAVDKGREDLALNLAAYYTDRAQYGILDVGVREKAILLQGTQPGSPVGIALRLMMQFKAFPTVMITKVWGREIYGGQGRMGALGGIVQLLVTATALGAVAQALNQIVKGQDPTAPWRNDPVAAMTAAFIKGGFGSIYGDYLFGEWNRHGKSFLGNVAGPTMGQADSLMTLWTQAIRLDENAGPTALRLARDNIPFMNMIYTKAPFDYMILYQMQEAMNPGYLRRMERRQKEDRGTEYWLKPSKPLGPQLGF